MRPPTLHGCRRPVAANKNSIHLAGVLAAFKLGLLLFLVKACSRWVPGQLGDESFGVLGGPAEPDMRCILVAWVCSLYLDLDLRLCIRYRAALGTPRFVSSVECGCTLLSVTGLSYFFVCVTCPALCTQFAGSLARSDADALF